MDLSGAILSFKTGDYTITRRTPAARVNGVEQDPTSATFIIEACVQPASGRQLQRLPDGMRQSETIAVYTSTELKTIESAPLADLISFKGKSYELANVKPFDDLGNYFECVAVKVRDL